MNCKAVFRIAAAISMIFVASQVYAAGLQYYNVDNVTLPNGPIELDPISATFAPNNAFLGDTSGVWTLSGDAVNLTAQTYSNVKYLDEWMFDSSTAFTYAGGNSWTSTDGNGWSVPTPDGALAPSVVLPVPSSWTSLFFPSLTASIPNPNVLYPYVDIGTGTVGPFASVPFSETIDATSSYDFDFTSSFISTTPPVPEPSALILAAFAGIGLGFVAVRRRHRAAA